MNVFSSIVKLNHALFLTKFCMLFLLGYKFSFQNKICRGFSPLFFIANVKVNSSSFAPEFLNARSLLKTLGEFRVCGMYKGVILGSLTK